MKLKEVREKLGYSRKQVCDYIGCSLAVYSRYERGTRQPSLRMLIKIADIFGVSLDFLVGRSSGDGSFLSTREEEFLELLRSSDRRAREDAYNILSSHMVCTGKNSNG